MCVCVLLLLIWSHYSWAGPVLSGYGKTRVFKSRRYKRRESQGIYRMETIIAHISRAWLYVCIRLTQETLYNLSRYWNLFNLLEMMKWSLGNMMVTWMIQLYQRVPTLQLLQLSSCAFIMNDGMVCSSYRFDAIHCVVVCGFIASKMLA